MPSAQLAPRQPDPDTLVSTAELFRLIGDPTRIGLLHALADAGELCVGDLATLVGVSENAVSQSVRLLRTADVVRARRQGRHVYYRLADDHVRLLVTVTVDHVRHAANDVRHVEPRVSRAG